MAPSGAREGGFWTSGHGLGGLGVGPKKSEPNTSLSVVDGISLFGFLFLARHATVVVGLFLLYLG